MSFLYSWVFNVFDAVGLSQIFSYFSSFSKPATILFLGLDNAGKTTLFRLLHDGKVIAHEPTMHPQHDEIQIGKVKLNAYDVGGHKAARKLWRHYLTDIGGIVFLVDTTDHERFDEVKKEINDLLSDEQFQDVPFLILGNKVDKNYAVSEQQLKQALGIHETCGKKMTKGKLPEGTQPIEVFMCSIVKKFGHSEGLKWLIEFM